MTIPTALTYPVRIEIFDNPSLKRADMYIKPGKPIFC